MKLNKFQRNKWTSTSMKIMQTSIKINETNENRWKSMKIHEKSVQIDEQSMNHQWKNWKTHEVRWKINEQITSKNAIFWFYVDFVGVWLQVGGSQGVLGGSWRPISSLLGVLIGSWAQDGPKITPRGLPGPIFEPNMAPRPPSKRPNLAQLGSNKALTWLHLGPNLTPKAAITATTEMCIPRSPEHA